MRFQHHYYTYLEAVMLLIWISLEQIEFIKKKL
jgi:hypothetical protein